MWLYLTDRLHSIVTTAMGRFHKSSGRGFIVACKQCGRDVPIGQPDFPFHSIPVSCPLCGAMGRYRPSEVTFGLPDELVRIEARKGLHARPMGKPLLANLFH
jgi:hypothetical protein